MMPAFAFGFALALAGCAAARQPLPPEPQGPHPRATGRATLRLGETALIDGVVLRAIRIEEDSRCPVNVQCVQAGTVRLRVALGTGGAPREAVLQLDQPFALGDGRWLRLAAVCPVPRAPGPIAPGSYRFLVSAAAGAPPPPPLDFACPAPP